MMITMITIQEESGALQLFTAETIKSVLRTERNQQMMSDVNFMSAVLATCRHPSLTITIILSAGSLRTHITEACNGEKS